jgi:hypothetical protein
LRVQSKETCKTAGVNDKLTADLCWKTTGKIIRAGIPQIPWDKNSICCGKCPADHSP